MIDTTLNSMERGKIAENIVKDLFEEAGFKVVRYGYEHLLPELANKDNLLQGRASDFIRHQPDFVIINSQNEAFFVEVKFRSEGKIKKEHMFPYPEGFVVFLTKDAILSQSIEEIYLKGENFKGIKDMKPFRNIPNSIIDKYVKVTKRKLGEETLAGQLFEGLITKITGKSLNQIKPATQPVIVGGGVDLQGWERLQEIPQWVINKIRSRKAKNIGKDKWLIHGEHFDYKVIYENKSPIGFRNRRHTR
ncbi:hypothetical protein FJZ21_01890 [Candidatus Pacearchaeota archaeon]|nr:hypothetical protein [Candidatus Pacearchaeota archaeon]